MLIAITGASGFIGSALTSSLEKDGTKFYPLVAVHLEMFYGTQLRDR